MNNRRFWLAFVAVYVVYHFFGWVVHGVWLGPVYEQVEGVFRAEEEMNALTWIFFVTSLVMVWCFCFIFTRGYENRGIGEGVRYGLYMGLFMMILQAFDSYAIYPLPYGLALNWFLSGMVMFMVMGIVLAAVYRPAD